VGLVICIAVLGIATLSFAGVPELSNCSATTAAGQQVNVFVIPDGQGFLMTEARAVTTLPQDVVDATITVTLLDAGMNAVFAYPFEDLWLETSLSGLVACPNGTIADASTDINGQTTFTGPFYAGGHSDLGLGEMTQVVVNGGSLPAASNLNILFNSADMDGNGLVDLTDVSLFSTAYLGGVYDFSADFFFDNALNLSDLVLFSGAVNIGCP
jgi:hypothetical protein